MKLRFAYLAMFAALAGCDAAPVESEPVLQTNDAMVVCADAETLDGLDVSQYEGDIDWAKVVASGKSFAFVKATEGVTYVDPTFAKNWAGMKQAGIARSAYHFFRPDDDAIEMADFYLQTLGPLEPGDLPPTLDLEVTDGQSASTITSKAIVWLDYVAQATGKKPILYTSRRVVTEYLGNAMGLEQHAILWDANWQVSCPNLPDTYSTWAFWQNTATGTVPGINASNVDLDVFNGNLGALQALGSDTSSGGAGGGASATGAAAGGNAATNVGSGAGGGPATTTGSVGGSAQAQAQANDAASNGGCSIGSPANVNGATLGLATLLAVVGCRRRSRSRAIRRHREP